MRIRESVVAGKYYPAESQSCMAELSQLLGQAASEVAIVERPIGGVVPHAGWAHTRVVAANVFAALAANQAADVDVVILFGGGQRHRGREAAMFGSGRWETPLGPVDVDARLTERILGHTNLIVDDPYAHEDEHCLEVQLPFVKHVFPQAKMVPFLVPATSVAAEVGQAVARTLKSYRYKAIIVGTANLTHDRPRHGVTPKGAVADHSIGNESDRRVIELVCGLKTEALVLEAKKHQNSCGNGAVTATVAACSALGARQGVLLEHPTSAGIALGHPIQKSQEDSVEYAGILFS